MHWRLLDALSPCYVAAVAMAAALAFCVACSRAPSPPSTHVDFSVANVHGPIPWKVTWRFSTPVMGLSFNRQKDHFRSRKWVVETPGLRFAKLGAGEALISAVPVHEIVIGFDSESFEVINDYAFLMPYSDGGMVIYLDHLHATPFTCISGNCDPPGNIIFILNSSAKTILQARPGHAVIIGTSRFSGAVDLPGEVHGLVYFGPQRPRDINDIAVILDPALPKWLRHDVEAFFPRFIDRFARGTGVILEANPVLYMSYGDINNERLRKSVAGVVNNQVAIAIQGGGWRARQPEIREEILHLLAHETFHLWNANRFQSPDVADGSWLHEGSAEAMAYRVLLDLGIIGRPRYLQTQAEILNRCIVGRAIRVETATFNERRRANRAHYDCGAALHFILAYAAGGEGRFSLYRFWETLFKAAEANQRVYTHEMFIAAAAELRANGFGQRVREFAWPAMGSAETVMQKILVSAGIATKSIPSATTGSEDEFPQWYRRLISERLVEILVDRDCRGNGIYSFSESGVDLLGADVCVNIKDSRKIDEIERRELFTRGVAAYDFVQKFCASRPSGQVNLSGMHSSLTLSCVDMPRRPKFLRLDLLSIQSFMFR